MRKVQLERMTKETDIKVALNIDGTGKGLAKTGIPFFDHMLHSMAKHGGFDLTCTVKGDLGVDCHHTIEDTGLVLGDAIKQAIGDGKGIRGLPMRSYPWMNRSLRWHSTAGAGAILSIPAHLAAIP